MKASARILVTICVGILATFSQIAPETTKVNKPDKFKCEVALVGKDSSARILGTFTLLNSEGESKTKSFRIPGSKNYVIASSRVDDEDFREGISIELAVSTNRNSKPHNGNQYAFSLLPGKSTFGRLSMRLNGVNRNKTASMVCEIDQEITK